MSAPTTGNPMTPQQMAIAVFMYVYQQANDNMPTMAQIADAFGTWSNAAHCHVKALRKRGVLEPAENPDQWRFARTEIGLEYRAQIIAERQRQGGQS